MQKKSYIKDGVLYCFYEIANFDEVIESALAEHNLEPGSCQVICKPAESSRCIHGMMSPDVCHFCLGGQPTKEVGGKTPEWYKKTL